MRIAFEAAFACAWRTAGCHPVTTSLDAVQFLAPVEIGRMLRFDAAVDYSDGNTFSVSVSSLMWDIDSGNAATGTATRLTNEFAFTFHSDVPMPQVYPVTYGEVSLASRRWHHWQ
jgi:acyl-CoA hydrolase